MVSSSAPNRVRLRFAAALLACALANAPAQDASSRFGLVAGRVYTYVGTIQWTDTAARAHSSPLHWRMEILQVRASHDVRGALVRGWIQELAWSKPGQQPAFSVLLEYGGGLYQLPTRDSAAAIDTLIDAVRDAPLAIEHFRIIIDSSLVIGHVFGGDPDRGRRDDALYAWLIESKTTISSRPQWLSLASAPARWRLVSRTVPDHELLDFVPGVGITRYVYAHHGTVANTDIRLSTVTSRHR